METEYIYIPKSTLESYKISKEHTLNADEVKKLTIYAPLIQKFIEQKAVSLQFQIWSWQWEWDVNVWFELVRMLWEIWLEVKNIWKTFEKYQESLNKDKEKDL